MSRRKEKKEKKKKGLTLCEKERLLANFIIVTIIETTFQFVTIIVKFNKVFRFIKHVHKNKMRNDMFKNIFTTNHK